METPSCGPAYQGSTESATSSIPPTMKFVKQIFARCSPENSIFKPLDDLLGGSSIESRDRFAGIRNLTLRLESEMYHVPRECSEQEVAKEVAQYVKSRFFPKVKERFESVDQSSGRFRVVVILLKFHTGSWPG